MTWLKNKLPKVDTLAMSQPRKRIFQFVLDASSDRDTIMGLQSYQMVFAILDGWSSAGETRVEVRISPPGKDQIRKAA